MSEVSLQVDGGLRYHLEEDVVHAVEAVYPEVDQPHLPSPRYPREIALNYGVMTTIYSRIV